VPKVKEIESRLERTEQQLRLFQKISRLMVREMSLQEVLQGIVSLIVEFMECDSCLVYLRDGEDLVLCSSNTPHPSTIGKLRMRSNEGLMVKDPESFYSPGRRGMFWFKLKKELATLDVVVVAAELGHGKRNKVLSDYTFAVRDETSGELLPIGKAYSGLTDAEIAELTDHFKQNTIVDRGRYREVKPDIVLEVAFDSIQPSTRHASGLALRFPRIVRIRTDKSPEEIDTLDTVREIFSRQNLGRKAKPPSISCNVSRFNSPQIPIGTPLPFNCTR